MDFSLGQIVYSKSGRDKGRALVVVKVEGEYLYLADGILRLMAHPKKKKKKHVQMTYEIDENLKHKIVNGLNVQDKELEKAVKRISALL